MDSRVNIEKYKNIIKNSKLSYKNPIPKVLGIQRKLYDVIINICNALVDDFTNIQIIIGYDALYERWILCINHSNIPKTLFDLLNSIDIILREEYGEYYPELNGNLNDIDEIIEIIEGKDYHN